MLGPVTTILSAIFLAQATENAKQRELSENSRNTDFENNSVDTQSTGITSIWNDAVNEVGNIEYITQKTFSDTEGWSDFWNKQNYIANSIIADGFSFEKLENLSDSWQEIRDNKKEGYQYINSDLSAKEQKQAREYAIELLKERYNKNIENYPDYGDVRKYYNEGSIADWILTHPVSFGANTLSEAIDKDGEVTPESVRGDETGSDNWYKTVSQDVLGQDGVFTPLNIATYIAHSGEGEIREDSAWDVFGNIKSTENIDKELAEYENYISELEKNIDNPEKFSEIFYKATEGMNFNPDNILEYKDNVESDSKHKPLETIIGRNYILEDIGKNEMMTNIAYEVNKTVGTKLCNMIPFVGPLVAAAMNIGVTALEEKTQENSEITAGEWTEIVLREGLLRYFAVNSSSITKNIFGDKGTVINTAIANGSIESGNTTAKLAGDIIDGNNITGDIVEAGTLPKATAKSTFKVGLKWFFSLFK